MKLVPARALDAAVNAAQLRVLYADYPHVVAADKKCNVVGLILLRLLADDELAAFQRGSGTTMAWRRAATTCRAMM